MRSKVWWSHLEPHERWVVCAYEKANKKVGVLRGGDLPDDCSECKLCTQPILGSGMCTHCNNDYNAAIKKANALSKLTTEQREFIKEMDTHRPRRKGGPSRKSCPVCNNSTYGIGPCGPCIYKYEQLVPGVNYYA